jgi:hypothetical protein
MRLIVTKILTFREFRGANGLIKSVLYFCFAKDPGRVSPSLPLKSSSECWNIVLFNSYIF